LVDLIRPLLERQAALRVPDRARLDGAGGGAAIDRVIILGASGTGKSTLLDAVRAAALPGVAVPVRFVTRPRREDDAASANVHIGRDEFERRVQAGAIDFHWVRNLDVGREERYGFAPVDAGTLPVYSGNNALYQRRAGVCPAGALDRALLVGIVA